MASLIRGRVTPELTPLVTIDAGNGEGDFQSVDVVVDTGFDGELGLSDGLIRRLGLTIERQVEVFLADGRRIEANAGYAVVSWQGRLREVVFLQIEGESLIGMSLLLDNRLTVSARPGGEVLIEEENL